MRSLELLHSSLGCLQRRALRSAHWWIRQFGSSRIRSYKEVLWIINPAYWLSEAGFCLPHWAWKYRWWLQYHLLNKNQLSEWIGTSSWHTSWTNPASHLGKLRFLRQRRLQRRMQIFRKMRGSYERLSL